MRYLNTVMKTAFDSSVAQPHDADNWIVVRR